MAKRKPHPGRTLLALLVGVALLYGAAALGKTWKPALGLDLEGGTQITLTAQKTPSQTQLKLARSIIEQRASAGVVESNVTTQGNKNIIVEVPGKNSQSLVDTVKRTAQLRFRLVAASAAGTGSSSTASPSASPSSTASPGTQKKKQKKDTVKPKNRVAPAWAEKPKHKATGTPKPKKTATASPTTGTTKNTQPTGPMTVKQALAWQKSPDATSQAKFLAYTCPKHGNASSVDDNPNKVLITCDAQGNKYLLSPALIEGTQLQSASFGLGQDTGQWEVDLSLKKSAWKTFGEITKALLANNMAFATVLDGEVISSAGASAAIYNGDARISGNFTESTARSLADSLKYGALPVKFKQPSVEFIGPSLAGNQLAAGVLAGAFGLGLVAIYCLLYYRALGLVVLASLASSAIITYATVLVLAKTAGFTLTLPGIAGLIVAVGITADSFIVYFERIRDEMRGGRSMRVAVETGWVRARNTCLAADAVSLLAAVVLYIFTIGIVRGFAFALGISTIIDLVVFFWFTKPLMTIAARHRFFNGGGSLSGLSRASLGIDGDDATPGRVVGGRA